MNSGSGPKAQLKRQEPRRGGAGSGRARPGREATVRVQAAAGGGIGGRTVGAAAGATRGGDAGEQAGAGEAEQAASIERWHLRYRTGRMAAEMQERGTVQEQRWA